MDLFALAYNCALFALPIVLYKIALPTHHGREKRIKDWYYALKRLLCVRKIAAFMNRSVTLPEDGPREAQKFWEEDVLVFHATDLSNNGVYIRFAVGNMAADQNEGVFAEICMQLRLADGRLLTLPDGVYLCALKRREWRTKVLTIIALPGGNFRLIFNGFLKQLPADDGDATVVEHWNFNFLFTVASEQLNYPASFDRALFADAICREPWRDGNWTQKLGDNIGNERFGTLHGILRDATWNLVAHHRRTFGTGERYDCDRSVAMLILTDDGTVCHVVNRRIHSHSDGGNCQIRHGAMLFPNGICQPITGCDLPLPSRGGDVGSVATVHMRTAHRQLKTTVHLQESAPTRHISRHWRRGYELALTTGVASMHLTHGIASFVVFKRKADGGGETQPEPLVGTKHFQSVPHPPLTVPLSDDCAQDLTLTGGKGQSLAILAAMQRELGYKVPPGFVVTTAAMERHFAANPAINAAIAELKMADDMTRVQASCARVQELIESTAMSEEMQGKITQAIEMLLQETGKSPEAFMVAVRSSGVAEDSESSSAAGQNETFLGCRSTERILEAVRQCWSSLYAFRSVEYRRQHGADVETTMAVVVQDMVDSRIAGVLFTCDLDGSAARMRITSNYGLGESIVSGEEGGDVVFIHRTWNNNVSIDKLEAHVKKTKISLNRNGQGGTQTLFVSENTSKTMSICIEEALRLATVATHLEARYGRHLDVEWAYEENALVLLQARPVTFLENWTDYELEHEFDAPITCDRDVYSTANVKEVMPGALTPLTASTIVGEMDRSVHDTITKSPMSVSVRGMRRTHLVTMRHHIFLNFYQVMLLFPSDKVDLTSQAVDLCVCGHQVTTQSMLDRAIQLHGRVTAGKQLRNILDSIRIAWQAPAIVAKVTQQLRNNPIAIREGASIAEVIAQLDRQMVLYFEIISAHSLTSRASSFYQMVSMVTLGGEGDGRLTPEKLAQIALFLSNGSGVISAEIPAELEAIATEIRSAPQRQAFLSLDVTQDGVAEKWLREHCQPAHLKYQAFLQQHGHRSFREFELMEPSWATRPATLMRMLQTLARLDDSTKKAAHLSVDEVIAQLDTTLNKRFLKFLINRCRSGVVLREQSKSEVVRLIDGIRSGFRALGERLHRAQYIPDAELVYFLTFDEIKLLVKTRDPVLVTKAMRRSRLYPTWDAYKLPEMVEGRFEPIAQRRRNEDTLAKLEGTPVCTGLVRARCCCIDDLRHIDELKKGDVLVTHGTDVGWTPYFPMLAGIVTELGGLISHGAVVAREYGLPCLIGVEGALDTFRTGDAIVLDATNGCIYKVKPELSELP